MGVASQNSTLSCAMIATFPVGRQLRGIINSELTDRGDGVKRQTVAAASARFSLSVKIEQAGAGRGGRTSLVRGNSQA